MQAVRVGDEAALRKAVFAHSALLVLLDGLAPSALAPQALAGVLRSLPASTLAVLWGAEAPWSRDVLPALEAAGVRIVALPRAEGIEPLLDLVLARYRGEDGPGARVRS